MRLGSIFLLFIFFSVPVLAQDEQKKGEPKITGQKPLAINEDGAITLQLTDLEVRDRDDWFYPWGFTLSVYPGANYSLNGQTVIPVLNFNGTLSVPVTVNDGEQNSEIYHVQITVNAVNDIPRITAQLPSETEQGTAFTLLLAHLTVSDPDNTYPDAFTLTILPPSDNTYTVSDNQITPSPGFIGTLAVPVKVNDGSADSEPFAFQLKVTPQVNAPVITGQVAVTTNEDQPITLQLAYFTVTDPDNPYPAGFTLKTLPGTNYTASGTVVTPAANIAGALTVNVVVNDGVNDSKPFAMVITVQPVNDAPEISKYDTNPVAYAPGKGPVAITQILEITDADNDSLVQAEVGFVAGSYRAGMDELTYTTPSSIKAAYDKQRGILTLTGRAIIADYIAAIRAIRYNFVPFADLPFEAKTMYVIASDGKLSSERKQWQIKTAEFIVDLDIPTAFTPNGDTANDTWSIRPLKRSDELIKAVVRIYNKRGSLLFETTGFDKEWDGRYNGELLPADIYYYTIDFDVRQSNRSFKGIVTLLR
jgi:gliding motility-associated-like protein